MASAKLTTTVRDTITSRILRYRFGGDVAQLIADRKAFAESCYDAVYDESTRKKIRSLPKGWLPTDSYMLLRFGTEMDRIHFNGHGNLSGLWALVEKAADELHRPLLAKHTRNAVVAIFDADTEVAAQHAVLLDRRTELCRRVKEAEGQIRSVVNSVTTTGKLREVWPEIGSFLDDFEDVKLSLPAVPVKELNAILDLPVETQTHG